MPTPLDLTTRPPGPLGGARLKLEWARAHIDSLRDLMTAVAAESPKELLGLQKLFDADKSTFVIRVAKVGELPATWALVLGDILNNARSTLDHVAWQLVPESVRAERRHRTNIYFPITIDPERFAADAMRKLPTVEGERLEAVRSVQPFTVDDPTGHPLAVLSRLNNADKHSQLHVVQLQRMNWMVTEPSEVKDFRVESIDAGQDIERCVDAGFFVGAEILRVSGTVTGPSPNVSGPIVGNSLVGVTGGATSHVLPNWPEDMVEFVDDVLKTFEALLTSS